MKANSGIPIGQWSGSDATNALHHTIKEFNDIATKQTKSIIRLTWAIVVLTLIMTAAVIIQVVRVA